MLIRRLLIALFTVPLLTLPPTAAAQGEYGRIEFETSCDADVAESFNRAVALLHHMMYEQSEAVFQDVLAVDPDCAMARWGIAMTQLHPLWAPPTSTELAKGEGSSTWAMEAGPAGGREQAYVEAVRAFFHTEGSFRDRLAAWESAQANLYETYPEDVDAAAFYALSRLATAQPDDRTFNRQAETGELLESLRDEHPEHPGLFHYTIHAYDNPVLAERAVEVARAYDQIAPEVAHALHMPSHIFVRLGYWGDVISWNRRSADAALNHAIGGQTSMHYPHAMDYYVYGHLQIGQDESGEAAVRELYGHGPFQPHLGSAYALAATPARVALERRDWPAAAALDVRDPESFPWERFPAAESITWFARGLGSAMQGDENAAKTAIGRLTELHDALLDAGEDYWAVHTEAQRMAIEAWVAFKSDATGEARSQMEGAADLEDSVDKHPVTPGSVLPMRELYGEMLLQVDRPADALEAFESSLSVSPGRLNSLTGAARAAELAGREDAAARYYEEAADLLEGRSGDARLDRPRMDSVHAFLSAN
ncbi:MAG: hypothetical protein WD423_10125 [Rhodothermales bacterium]